jgi:uncharacterized protein (TIGR00369 family)
MGTEYIFILGYMQSCRLQGGITVDLLATLQDRRVPFADTLGIRLTSVGPERVTAELEVREDLCTSVPILHGGALMAFADTLGAVATAVNIPADAATTTLESKTNFFAPAPLGSTVRAETTPLHRGKTTQVWQTRITNVEGRLLAQVTQTQMVLPPRG